MLTGFLVPLLNAGTELLLLLGGEKGDFIDFLEIGLEATFSRNSGPPCQGAGR